MNEVMRQDIASLKTDVADIRVVMRNMLGTLVRIEESMRETRAYMFEKCVTRDEFHSRMDGFSAKLEDSRFRWAVHADTLQRHDERLSTLEKRRAP